MNRLSTQKRIQILDMLVEGMSMRSVSRVVGVSINTVSKLLVDAGRACALYHDEHVRGVEANHIQCDEIWSFCYCKQKTVEKQNVSQYGAGDVWTWTGMDRDSKLMISYVVGDRTGVTGCAFMNDLSSRLSGRVQLITDGHRPYLEAVEEAFGCDVDFAQLVKVFNEETDRKESVKRVISGNPVEADISTSIVERQNLNMRMGMRRFTRKTNAFSKKLENHFYMLSLYFVYYNFIREHLSLETTPAVKAGLCEGAKEMRWVVEMVDERQPKPNRPKKYRKRISN